MVVATRRRARCRSSAPRPAGAGRSRRSRPPRPSPGRASSASAVAGAAVDGHAKRVVVLAEIGVLAPPSPVALRIEAARPRARSCRAQIAEQHLAGDRARSAPRRSPRAAASPPPRAACARRLERELRPLRRHRMAAARLRLGQPDDLRRRPRGMPPATRPAPAATRSERMTPCCDLIGDQRQERPVRSGRASVGAGAMRDAPGLQLALGVARAAAGEHRVDRLRRSGVARHAQVVPGGADGGDRQHSDAQRRASARRRRSWRSPPSRARAASAASGGTARTAPSPPKTKGKDDAAERIADRADDRRARHVHGLVAAGAAARRWISPRRRRRPASRRAAACRRAGSLTRSKASKTGRSS